MLFTIVLTLHIISGSLGLLLGTVVLLRKKGDTLHKNIGKVFAISMVINGLSAFYLSYVHPNLFLFIVGIFSIYLTISGYRMIHLKKIHEGQKLHTGDLILTFLMFLSSLLFLYIGIRYLAAKAIFGIVFMLFGIISIRLCYSDYRAHTGRVTDKMHWLKNHIGRMCGAYIAALTAFLVVNNTFLPDFLVWSLPGIIGGIFVTRTIKKLN